MLRILSNFPLRGGIALVLLPALVLSADAGDILRGGAAAGGTRRTAQPAANSGAEAAARSQANAKDRLARTTAAIEAVRALLKSAREATSGRIKNPSGRGNLPRVADGLAPGGLEVDPRVPKNLLKPGKGENAALWVGADLPKQTQGKNGEKNVTIVQNEQQAFLNWKTFNVGKKTSLYFDQSAGGSEAGKWIAFNKINDPSTRPSQILGSIKAEGQIYVLNQNGILFGGSSQVNVHALVASALPINTRLVANGLLNNPDAEFLFSAVGAETFDLSNTAKTLSQIADPRDRIELSYTDTAGRTQKLAEGDDYTVAIGKDRKSTINLTTAGAAKLAGAQSGTTLQANYVLLNGDVTVLPGAQITSPTSAAHVGGRVFLAGANVKNEGTISTPDGQAILAAGLEIGMLAHSKDDPSLRGVDIFVGEVGRHGGRAVNEGLIDAPRASVLMTGKSVQQNGIIDSTTSVSLNGRIDLIASYDAITNGGYDSSKANSGAPFLYQSTGIVTLGEDSVTRILPEWSSTETAAASELSDKQRSQINIQGLAVHFDTGSTLWAPNANVNVQAGRWQLAITDPSFPPTDYRFVYPSGQIYLEPDAVVDVSGSTAVVVPLDENILQLELRGSELADSPLQRDGALRAVPIVIDARLGGTFNGRDWVGTPLGDATGFLGLIQRGIGALTAGGGSVTFQAGDSVVMQASSKIDVSGGWFNNQGGLVKTTKLMQGTRLVDIADATPDQLYDGIYDPKFTTTSSKWGVTKTYRHAFDLNQGHYESDSIQGAAGGSISITASSMALDGTLTGETVIGPRQLRKNSTTSTLPKASRLSLAFKSQDPEPYSGKVYSWTSLHAPDVVFANTANLPKPFAFALDADGDPLAFEGAPGARLLNPFRLRTSRRDTVVLSPELFTTGGFGSLAVDNGAGDISVPADVTLETRSGGSIALNGRNIDVQGRILAPDGTLSFTANNLSPYLVSQFRDHENGPNAEEPILPLYAKSGTGIFTLGAGAVISTAGQIIDLRDENSAPAPLVSDGGTIDIAAYTANLAPGSLADVSGGVLVDTNAGIHYGDAGSLTVRAGIGSTYYESGSTTKSTYTALLPPVDEATGSDWLIGGRLRLGGELRGYSGAQGGSLALQAPFFQIGGTRATAPGPGTVLLKPEFFNTGGFAKFDLTGMGGAVVNGLGEREILPSVVIAAGTALAPRAQSLFADPSGGPGATLAVNRVWNPLGLRSPVSLGFHAIGLANSARLLVDGIAPNILARGVLEMRDGASIHTDPLADVELTAPTGTVAVLGDIVAPAGSITITGSSNSKSTFNQPLDDEKALTTVYIGSRSQLSTAGTTIYTPDAYGRRTGRVLAGGTIDIAGNIVAAAGSSLNVSGTSAVLDVSPLLLDPAASLTVPATSGLNAPLQKLQTVAVQVDSDAGAITLTGGEQLFTDALLIGRAGGPAAVGGELRVSSGRFVVSSSSNKPAAATLVVTQDRAAIRRPAQPSLFGQGEQTGIGEQVLDAKGEALAALGYFAADTFLKGGFDSLTLGGSVRFKGPVDISASGSLRIADSGVLIATDAVRLSAPYVAIGQDFPEPALPDEPNAPFGSKFGPTRGPGELTVSADLIDIGTLSLHNIRRASFLADNGDIRGAGTLNIAGHLRLRAGQIYTPSALDFTVVAYDYKGADWKPGQRLKSGSIAILSSGSRSLPLSAGGTLSFYASEIDQRGVLRAPMGTINLGWDGTGDTPEDLVTGDTRRFPVTKRLALGSASITSVSAIDPATGKGLLIPYGVSLDGNTWIDPRGLDITSSGLPGKAINLSADRISTKRGSQLDLRGGGDLYAYRWIEGNGGTTDLLSWNLQGDWAAGTTYLKSDLVKYNGRYWYARANITSDAADALSAPPSSGSWWRELTPSYAVMPGYDAGYAPVATNNSSVTARAILQNDAGYASSTLSVGERVYLGASNGLAAGYYTLLPARYALLPGAFLVTPQSGSPTGTLAMADGSSVVAGYRSNGLRTNLQAPALYSRFEVASSEVLRSRAEYEDFVATRFLRQSAARLGNTPQLLPDDAGHLVFQATGQMHLSGIVRGQGANGGRGAFIDISSPADILISGRETPSLTDEQTRNTIVLKSSLLTSWGAESLLVGGIRKSTEDGTLIDVQTGNLTIDNAGSPLAAPEILLAANDNLTVASGSRVIQSGSLTQSAERLTIDGDGAFLRVSSDTEAAFSRINVTEGNTARMAIGAGTLLAGASITLDSSHATDLSAKALLRGRAINLSSGQISLVLEDAPALRPTAGLVLAGRALQSLRDAESISLSSYSSLDVYGTGRFGSDSLANLELHAGEIRGFNDGGAVTFLAVHILLDNAARGVAPGVADASSGALTFRANVIELGSRALRIDQFDNVHLAASGAVFLGGKGRLLVDADLDVETPAFFATGGATAAIRATGNLEIRDSGTDAATGLAGGLGANLSLQGATVLANSDVLLPSGQLTLRATKGDVTVNGRLDVGGEEQHFNDLTRYTSGGTINLIADKGDVTLGRRGALDVAAPRSGGDAGLVNISAASANGSVKLAGTLDGQAGKSGSGGRFALDVGSLAELGAINGKLDAAGFTESRNFRVRHGDVLVDGTATSREFRLSADSGSILVRGTLDASGATGGIIALAAAGDLTLADGAVLDASGRSFSSAGKGGAATLEAGAQIDGQIDNTARLDIRAGSRIDLSVDAATAASESLGLFTGTLHLRAPQDVAGTDLQIDTVAGKIAGASNVLIEGYRLWDLSLVGGVLSTTGSTTQAAGGVVTSPTVNVLESVKLASTTFGSAGDAIKSRILAGDNAKLGNRAVVAPGVEIINRAGYAPVSFTLNTAGASSVATPSTGGTILFPTGTTGDNKIVSNRAGTLITRDGTTIAVAANTPTSVPAGASLVLGQAATVSFASGSGGPIDLQLTPGTTFTSSTANASGSLTTRGSAVTLNSPGNSAVSLGAGGSVLFSTGTPGTRRIISSVPATIVTANGTTIALAANTPTTISAGSTLTLSTAGQISYATGGAGSGGPQLTLLDGALTTSGVVAIAPSSGNLVLGSSTATAAAGDWDLSSLRFGPQKAPGVLTLRAAGNLVLLNTLSDGFASSRYDSLLLDANTNLPMNAQSWSYRLAAGADLTAADFRRVTPLASLAAGAGSLQLGRNNLKNQSNSNGNSSNQPGSGATTENAVIGDGSGSQNRYQVIRTGSGDIDIVAGRDVQLLNQFATIYTAGTKISDPTMGGTFDLPQVNLYVQGSGLGATQPEGAVLGYEPQYTLGGGDVRISAQRDITHLTRLTATGPLVADSSRQLPVNWLYRRGYIDPATGAFGTIPIKTNPLDGSTINGDVASTTWWIDFSNFFEGVGALGGGNVSLLAGNDVSNVDAVAPTNARLPKTAKSADALVELGGGDVIVRAGHDIDAGVYYVERGSGVLEAGNTIHTNSTRSPSLAGFETVPATQTPGELSWMPTTLFLGKGGFDVSARGDVLLGPVANPFLLPEGLNNGIFYKTTFSTYSAASRVNVSSLGGDVTLRMGAPLGNSTTTTPFLQGWLRTQLLLTTQSRTSAYYQPWLRLNVTNVDDYSTAVSILPPTLRASAFSGDINLAGTLNLLPSARGTIELAAAGAINGLQPTGQYVTSSTAAPLTTWDTSQINLSDANPASIPGVFTPAAYLSFLGSDITPTASASTQPGFLLFLDQLFAETGATDSVLQVKQALHSPGLLHAGDPEPARLYALGGDISGLTFFSAKSARISADRDITDIAFYLQNTAASDVSVVSAGRDIIPSNANSPLRALSNSTGNFRPGSKNEAAPALAGDIQLAGAGTLEVLAGRNLDLGTGAGNADGTGTGITTIGNARNTYLPFEGASLVVGAGIGPSSTLSRSSLDFDTFVDEFLTGESGEKYLTELDPKLTPEKFAALPKERRDLLALEAFYLVLRDSGRAQTDGTGSYDTGYAAIESLFGSIQPEKGVPLLGDITTRSRDIRTKSGGDISIFVPHGELTLANNTIGEPLIPPGIVTESGGNVSIFTDGDVDIGVGRIFTLKGGNMVIWSSTGDIAAGVASKTVKSAPPTRVLFDPQSADVQTDLAGLSTGGGIGVLATVAGVEPGDVDLIAPVGVVDAGDAGIRVSGNLNIAATAVLNASNIAVSGSSSGVPSAPVVAAPNIAGLTSASTAAGAANQAADKLASQARQEPEPEETPSIIDVQVVGYGGGDDASL